MARGDPFAERYAGLVVGPLLAGVCGVAAWAVWPAVAEPLRSAQAGVALVFSHRGMAAVLACLGGGAVFWLVLAALPLLPPLRGAWGWGVRVLAVGSLGVMLGGGVAAFPLYGWWLAGRLQAAGYERCADPALEEAHAVRTRRGLWLRTVWARQDGGGCAAAQQAPLGARP